MLLTLIHSPSALSTLHALPLCLCLRSLRLGLLCSSGWVTRLELRLREEEMHLNSIRETSTPQGMFPPRLQS